MILVVDAMNALYRGTFGAGKKLSTPNGFDITPTYGFIKILVGLLRRFPNVQKLVIASDPVERNRVWRKQQYPGYKATRKDADAKQKRLREVVYANAPYVKALSKHFNCGWFEDPEWEADDQIAMVAHWANTHQQRCIVVSADRDLLQLVELPYVEVCYPTQTDYLVVDHQSFFSQSQQFIYKKGKEPRQLQVRPFTFWKAMVGDKSDNIGGHFSEVMAHDIVSEYYGDDQDSPVALVADWWNVVGAEGAKRTKKVQKIVDIGWYRVIDDTARNWNLMHLRHDVVQTRSYHYGSWNPKAIESWFRQVNFRSLLPGGESYQHFNTTIGRLQPCLLS